jgi:DNA-binding transcriptional regulator YhcF (GntR family)
MNIRVDTTSPIPPYEQLRSQIRVMVTSGTLARETRLPTIRQLAGDLGLAVNTVGRAYRELENEGLIETRGRHGTVVTGPPVTGGKERQHMIEQAAGQFVLDVSQQGADLDEALAAVRRAFTANGHAPNGHGHGHAEIPNGEVPS